MPNGIEFIIIGDVHGRDFWKVAASQKEIPIVFVGDYLDPYTSIENITSEHAIDNFKEIMDFAKGNKNVTLLYGNHDSYAFDSTTLCSCRHDWIRYEEIKKLYSDNRNLFSMASDFKVKNKDFLITHAGLNPYWIEYCWKKIYGENAKINAKTINMPMEKKFPYGEKQWFSYLCMISSRRGGLDPCGSFLWSDISDHLNMASEPQSEIPDNIFQIFGHSWIREAIRINGSYNFACVDCKRAVYVDSDGQIRYLDNDKEIKDVTL